MNVIPSKLVFAGRFKDVSSPERHGITTDGVSLTSKVSDA